MRRCEGPLVGWHRASVRCGHRFRGTRTINRCHCPLFGAGVLVADSSPTLTPLKSSQGSPLIPRIEGFRKKVMAIFGLRCVEHGGPGTGFHPHSHLYKGEKRASPQLCGYGGEGIPV